MSTTNTSNGHRPPGAGLATLDVLDITEATRPAPEAGPDVAPEAGPVNLGKAGPETDNGPASVGAEAEFEASDRPGGNRLMPAWPRLPGWVRDPKTHAHWWVEYALKLVAAMAVQSVRAAGKATLRSVTKGPHLAVTRTHAWATDPASKKLLDGLAGDRRTDDFLRVHRARKDTVGQRPALALAAGLALVALMGVGLAGGNLRVRLAVIAGWVTIFGGIAARDESDPLFRPVTIKDPRFRKLTGDQLTDGFVHAGLASAPDAKAGTRPGPLAIVVAPHRDGINAEEAIVDLPKGLTFEDARKKRVAIASGMRCQSACLFLQPDRWGPDTHEGRIIVRKTRVDPMAQAAGITPLLDMDRTDVFGVLPVGLDERGDLVTISPLWRSMLFSGRARSGKSFCARLVALGIALDPMVRVGAVFCGKGSTDHRPLARLAHSSGFGPTDEVRKRLLATLKTFGDEIVTRNEEVAALPKSERGSEGKLTKALTKRFPVVLILIDEVQEFFSKGNRKDKLGLAIEREVERIVKTGPSMGFITILSTQRPDKESVPPALKDQFQLRVGLRNTGDAVQIMALGSGSADLGFDVRTLRSGDHYRGASYVVGEGLPERYYDGGTICKWHLADEDHAEAIIERAYQARVAKGLLTGMAVGEAIDTSSATLLDDVAAAFDTGDLNTGGRKGPWLWSWQIINRLAELFPSRYSYDPQRFGVAAAGVGLTTEDISKRVDGKPVTNAGLYLDTITTALTARAAALEPDPEPEPDNTDEDVDGLDDPED